MRCEVKNHVLRFLSLLFVVAVFFLASIHNAEGQPALNSEPAPAAAEAPAAAPAPAAALASEAQEISKAAPVIVGGKQLFSIEASLGPITAAERAKNIVDTLKRLESDQQLRVGLLEAVDKGAYTDISCGDIRVMSVTEGDANMNGVSRQALSKKYAEHIKKFLIESKMTSHAPSALTSSLKHAGIATAVLFGILLVLAIIGKNIRKLLESWKGKYIKTIKIQNVELLAEDTIYSVVFGSIKLVRTVIQLTVLFTYAVTVLSFFPQTEQIAFTLKDQVIYAIFQLAGPAILGYLPNLFFMLLIVVVTRYVIKFIKFVANELERGTLKLPGFEKEWVAPTANIVRFLVLVFAAMLIFPYLPGSGSPAFQQITIFLGVLLSLGSTGAVAHIIAGIFLTYTGAFRMNDRVQIADTIGDVVGRSLLATRVRTIKHEYITVPNGLVLGSHIVNYSASRSDPGLILHSTVTLGYDLDWRVAHELLINAAKETKHIVSEPAPFVLQTSLNDHHVAYQINAYTDAPSSMALVYSELHRNILDRFRDAGVEILSPEYRAIRDGNKLAIPEIKS